MNFTELTAFELADKIKNREFSALEMTEAALEQTGLLDGKVKAFVTMNAEGARLKAKKVDEKIAKGEKIGVLAGVPIALKDNMCLQGLPTTCSSKILQKFHPPYNATIVERLETADAVILGKTNLDEFAMGSSTENSALFVTKNPWNIEHAPGGSSGGSAAAVAARMVPMALGSDTGGSIRQPASFCGILGMKPTYGRVSRFGLVAFASSLDQIGPMTRDVRDAALLLNVISGHDKRDTTSANEPVPNFLDGLEKSISGLKIGLPKEYFDEGLSKEVGNAIDEAIEVLKKQGAEFHEISLPHTEYAVATYYLVATAEASSNLGRYDGVHYGHRSSSAKNIVDMYSESRREGFGPEVKRRIMLGTYALSAGFYDAFYMKALKVRTLIRQDFENAFENVDCILCPTSPTSPFRLGDKIDDPLSMYLSDIYTISLNLAGLPGLSIPSGFDSQRLPIGLQLIGRAWDEATILRVADAFQRMTDHHLQSPELQ